MAWWVTFSTRYQFYHITLTPWCLLLYHRNFAVSWLFYREGGPLDCTDPPGAYDCAIPYSCASQFLPEESYNVR